MSEIINGKTIVIERVRRDVHVDDGENGLHIEEIARFTAETGIVPTEHGDLSVEVCPPDKQNRQKVIFSGEVIPTVHIRGKNGHNGTNQHRRIVSFPTNHGRNGIDRVMSVTHEVGKDETLVFRRIDQARQGIML